MSDIELIVEDLIAWLRERVEEAGAKGLVFGLSGGIDSAVMAGLSKLAFPSSSLGVIMPCHSDSKDEEDALLVARALGLETKRVDLTKTFDTMIGSLNLSNNKLALANIKPRLRMTTLYYYAQSLNYLVAGSTNKSEFYIGYFTKHGDSSVDLLPLADFLKSEIWEMADYLNIPKSIIDKVPSAGLWDNQTDEEEMGFSYQVLDNFIRTGEAAEDVKSRILTMNARSLHKQVYPPIYKQNRYK
ncbi:MAG: NAD(+) synthase [Tissierellaceae bacterium]|jgi:NAD+ synthase|nr:NAD(+) synthase [Tissierellia bacterium]